MTWAVCTVEDPGLPLLYDSFGNFIGYTALLTSGSGIPVDIVRLGFAADLNQGESCGDSWYNPDGSPFCVLDCIQVPTTCLVALFDGVDVTNPPVFLYAPGHIVLMGPADTPTVQHSSGPRVGETSSFQIDTAAAQICHTCFTSNNFCADYNIFTDLSPETTGTFPGGAEGVIVDIVSHDGACSSITADAGTLPAITAHEGATTVVNTISVIPCCDNTCNCISHVDQQITVYWRTHTFISRPTPLDWVGWTLRIKPAA